MFSRKSLTSFLFKTIFSFSFFRSRLTYEVRASDMSKIKFPFRILANVALLKKNGCILTAKCMSNSWCTPK